MPLRSKGRISFLSVRLQASGYPSIFPLLIRAARFWVAFPLAAALPLAVVSDCLGGKVRVPFVSCDHFYRLASPQILSAYHSGTRNKKTPWASAFPRGMCNVIRCVMCSVVRVADTLITSIID